MTLSIRTRLLAGISAGMAILLIVFSFVIYEVIRRVMINQFDSSLLYTARMLSASVELENGKIGIELESEQMPEFQRKKHPTYYELWKNDGTMAVKSPSLGDDDFLHADSFIETPAFKSIKFKNRRHLRIVGFRFIPRNADNEERNSDGPNEAQLVTLIVGRDVGDMHHNLLLLRWLLLIASVSTIVLSFIIGGFVVKQGLGPLNFLADEIASIKENNLTSKIAGGILPAEIQPIRNRLNEMLGRLEESFNRERRFTADVAHELRTPLAGIRSTIEVNLFRNREQGEYAAAFSDCLAIAEGMQKMVDNLLVLSRIDTNQTNFRRDRVMVAEIIDSCWRLLSLKAAKHGVNFENRIPVELTCRSDSNGMSMVISNILDNAVEYTNQGGQIKVDGREAGSRIEVTIANTGCRLANDEVLHVFDWFWRADSSRTDTGTHFGLGLALVRRIVTALGGSASVEVKPGGIFIMHLVLPA
jgi:two-component system heavy metal sensor histidine kinase CusS